MPRRLFDRSELARNAERAIRALAAEPLGSRAKVGFPLFANNCPRTEMLCPTAICVSFVAVPPNSVPFGVNSEAVSTLICVIAGLAFCINGGRPFTVILGRGVAMTVAVIRDERSNTRLAWITDAVEPAPCCTATSWPTIMSAVPAKENAAVFRVPTRLSIAKGVALSATLHLAAKRRAGSRRRLLQDHHAELRRQSAGGDHHAFNFRQGCAVIFEKNVAWPRVNCCLQAHVHGDNLSGGNASEARRRAHRPTGNSEYCVLELVVTL